MAPNIVPAQTEMLYYLRATTSESLDDLVERAYACFAAGALATGCTHEIRTVSPTYAELCPDPILTRLIVRRSSPSGVPRWHLNWKDRGRSAARTWAT